MANIDRLPSGSYRIRKMYQGKNYTITLDHKPSQKEIMEVILDQIKNNPPSGSIKGSFQFYANKYVEIQNNLLSPSTIRSYKGILNNLSDDFKKMEIGKIKQDDVTNEINDYSATRSAKSVRNAHAFISTVLKMYRPELALHTKLPQKQKYDKYVPTQAEVAAIINEVKGTRYYIPFRLACYGLRRGEICALEPSDLSDTNILSINKVKAQNEDNKWVIKPYPKTVESTRTIYIDNELAELIRDGGIIFNGHPTRLADHLKKVQNKLGLHNFRFHDFRAYFCTELSQAGISEADIMKMGGWSTPNIMKSVYRQARIQKDIEAQQNASKIVSDFVTNS